MLGGHMRIKQKEETMLFSKKISDDQSNAGIIIPYGCSCTCNHPNQPGGKSSDYAKNFQNKKTNNGTCTVQPS